MTKHKQKEAAEVEKKENPQNHKNEVAAEEKKDASKRRKEVAANEKVQDKRNKVTQSVREEVAREKTDSPYSRSKRVPGPKSEYRRQTDRMFAASVFLVVIFVHDVQRSR